MSEDNRTLELRRRYSQGAPVVNPFGDAVRWYPADSTDPRPWLDNHGVDWPSMLVFPLNKSTT